jgi:F-type H+-transporting ATPase subunit gamma
MANSKAIKNRIKSVKNTKKITKAMELVAASKMKRAVGSTLASRIYAQYSWDILTSIANSTQEVTHPLFIQREVKNTLLVLITSNRGLCGAYNAQVIKKALQFLRSTNTNVDILTIGKKGDAAMRRVGKNVIASFVDLPDNITTRDILPVAKLLTTEYTKGTYDKVVAVYTDYVSALSQKANVKQILPVSKQDLKELLESIPTLETAKENKTAYLFEGDVSALIGSLARKLTRMQIYQMMLESNASEQSARMVAMKNASEASGEMIDELTLVFNKARQAGITQEISEISAGMVSLT